MPSAPELFHFIKDSTTIRAGVAYGKHRSVLQSCANPQLPAGVKIPKFEKLQESKGTENKMNLTGEAGGP